ncbi:hypothetical protein K432DRAFT_53686 [Lepidopterella palustris CBS 459.81]|uniref:Uncharacterized protein n=1 Tax=Lepidopterella palustris CBS 459.81 TaxID=1314670 RepID=A0A8E2E9Q6_9PEZI|nr:hypothetical protein K432DRAFT_53686 [Lepidopterella palustris CBS 459.81]
MSASARHSLLIRVVGISSIPTKAAPRKLHYYALVQQTTNMATDHLPSTTVARDALLKYYPGGPMTDILHPQHRHICGEDVATSKWKSSELPLSIVLRAQARLCFVCSHKILRSPVKASHAGKPVHPRSGPVYHHRMAANL